MVRTGLLLMAFLLASCSGGSVSDDGEDAGGAADADGYSADDGFYGDDGGPGEPDAGGDDAGPQDDGPPPDPNECARMQADWVFCSGFEEGNKDIWDDYDDNPDETNLLMEDPGPLDLLGNHVMRLRVPAGRGGADLVKVLDGSYDKLYARWYVKWEVGYDFNARNHGSGLHAGDRNLLGRSDYRPEGDDWFCSWIEPIPDNHRLNAYTYYRGMYMDCADPQGTCWGDHFPCMFDEGTNYCEKPQHRETVLPPVMETGRWYCIEMMLDGGTPTTNEANADGTLDFWVDGLEIGPWDDLWLRTTPDLKLTVLWLSIFHHGDHSQEGLMFDNVVVSTSRIGCF
jgi:hypothetical protein